jgi:hypothetical protein
MNVVPPFLLFFKIKLLEILFKREENYRLHHVDHPKWLPKGGETRKSEKE